MRTIGKLLLAASMPMLGMAAEPAAPELSSVAPLGGTPGSSFEAVVRGKNLEEATAVWSPSAGLVGEALRVEPGQDAKASDRLRVRFQLAADVPPGAHDVRLISPHGLSNALRLLVHEHEAVVEQTAPHDLARSAQMLAGWPAVVHGRIAEVGEVDFYAFRVESGQQLLFRTFSSGPLDAGLAIYELTGSWFDADRSKRLAFADEPVEYPGEPTEAVLRHRFDNGGEYLVRVNGFWGYGGEDQVYALLIDPAPNDETEWPPGPPGPLWTERSWKRPLEADRMERLAGRTVFAGVPADISVVDADAEPTKTPVEPPEIEAPTMITGTIERPGDIDRVRFSVGEGDKLVFEIQTPDKSLPQLNPLLRVIDADGVEVLTNIWSRVNANGNISKQIYPKTQYAFPRAGDFTLEIRDITVSYGDGAMRYMVLVRPWVPHLGEAHVNSDRLNLVAGKAAELSVVIDQEEGYDGLATFSLEGLPPGVEAVTGAAVDPDSPPAFNPGKKERFTTTSQKATVVLLPAADAPLSREPAVCRLYARPVLDGRMGKEILLKELLVMVVADHEGAAVDETLHETR